MEIITLTTDPNDELLYDLNKDHKKYIKGNEWEIDTNKFTMSGFDHQDGTIVITDNIVKW